MSGPQKTWGSTRHVEKAGEPKYFCNAGERQNCNLARSNYFRWDPGLRTRAERERREKAKSRSPAAAEQRTPDNTSRRRRESTLHLEIERKTPPLKHNWRKND